jgi:surface antigen
MSTTRFTHSVRRIGTALLFTAGLSLAVPALSAPPDHAPAHGWRKKNDPRYVGYQGRQWPADYGVIEGRCDRAAIGTVLGGVVGGAIGSQVSNGSDRVVATILGTAIGAVIGREIGKNMDDADRACIGHALELTNEGQRVRWVNDHSGVTYVLTPLSGKQADSSCRRFQLQTTVGGRAQTRESQACRTGDGTWQLAAA